MSVLAQVKFRPATTFAAEANTGPDGDETLVVLPVPSCPWLFHPQHETLPSAFRAQV